MKGLIIFAALVFCLCVGFVSTQLNSHARYQLEQIIRENHWENTLTYKDLSHELFSSSGQILGAKFYAYPDLSIEKITVAELTPTRAVVVMHDMEFEALHTLQNQSHVEESFRTYQPITHLLQRPLHSLLLINQAIVRMDAKLVVSQTKQKAIVDIIVDAEQIGQAQARLFLYPVTDNFVRNFITMMLQGRILPADLAELPIVKTEIAFADKGGLERYRAYLDTLPASLVEQVKKEHPQLAQFIVQPKSEMKIDAHPFKRKPQ